ncbi:PucR family transcriptional regulator [Nocardia camponoti]|uniref:Transcriptional regulator n=1 Tax=Nocardia camponoti TaxID=1616106 RepID=A0A917V4K0_9NOCA|nr:helix-turn-helix domain-containing protein [Nocardia camponoti]GGK38830.1 transcriptional regulator [Nocardia camponoti]
MTTRSDVSVVSSATVTATRLCKSIISGLVAEQDCAHEVAVLSRAAAGWAREGVPLDSVLRVANEALRDCVDEVYDYTGGHDRGDVTEGFRRAVRALDMVSSTVGRAYGGSGDLPAERDEAWALRELANALIAGRPTETLARACGIQIADHYAVLAISFASPESSKPGEAARILARIGAALAHHSGGQALSMLSIEGGTVLIPTNGDDDPAGLARVVDALARVAGRVTVTAAHVSGPREEIPAATQRAHEVLDMVEQLDSAPGLYHFTDLALEYQLTRPGPGRARLRQLLAPLDAHPELFETLRVHIGNELNRQRTARLLHVHANTVDYRLRRVAHLTGLDPTQASGLWQLRSAMIACGGRTLARIDQAG